VNNFVKFWIFNEEKTNFLHLFFFFTPFSIFILIFLGWARFSQPGSVTLRLVTGRPKKQAHVNWFKRTLHSVKVINFTFALFLNRTWKWNCGAGGRMLTWVKTATETKTRVMILAPAKERPTLPFPFQSHSPLSLVFCLLSRVTFLVLSLSLSVSSSVLSQLPYSVICLIVLLCFLFNRFSPLFPPRWFPWYL
jgi:hypothetical protein